jgi:general secretion pathway protein F
VSSATPELAAHESRAPHIEVAALTEPDDLALFHRSLAQLCRAEVPLGKAFRVLDGELERGSLRTAVREMAEAVEAGTPLAEAYAQQSDAFPPLYRHLVEGGMACGDLPGTLEEIARHASKRAEVAERLRRALSYPLVTAIVVLVGGTALVTWAGPAFDCCSARSGSPGSGAHSTARGAWEDSASASRCSAGCGSTPRSPVCARRSACCCGAACP